MKRLLCILDSLDTGGAETFLMKLYRALDRETYRIDFVVCKDGFYDEEVRGYGGKIYKIPLRTQNFAGSFHALKKIVRDNGYSCVLKLGSSPIVVTDLLAARLGGASKICLRSCNAPTSIRKKQKLIDALLRPVMNHFASVKIAPSDLAAEYTFGKKAVMSGNVFFLKNAVDLNYFSFDGGGAAEVRRELGLEKRFVVGHVGRFNSQKNHVFLLDVFEKIVQLRQDATLLLVGVGELEETVRKIAETKGLTDRVCFAGRRTDIPKVLSAMDVFVFPSLYEGMPNTIIEAQAVGLPCVLSDAITKEANVTDRLCFISLSETPMIWAKMAVKVAEKGKYNSRDIMEERGYSIDKAADEFTRLCF